MLATTQAQTRRNGNHWLPLAIELQCQDLSWRQHHRGSLGGLLEKRSRRMHIGEGPPSKTLACQASYSGKAYQG